MKIKLTNIKKSNKILKSLTPSLYVNNSKKLLWCLKNVKLSDKQYEKIYQLLIKQKIPYGYIEQLTNKILQEREIDIPTLLFQSQTDKYTIPMNEYKMKQYPTVYTHSVTIPQFIKKAYTLPLKSFTMYDKSLYDRAFSKAYYYLQLPFTFDHTNKILDLIAQGYSGKQQINEYPITHQVLQPPTRMIRYVDETLQGWKVVKPSPQLIGCQISSQGRTITITMSKNVMSPKTSGSDEKRYTQWVYPNPVQYQLIALGNNHKNVNAIFQFKDIHQQDLMSTNFLNTMQASTKPDSIFNTDPSGNWKLLYDDSKYLNLKYDNTTMEKLKIGFTLEDKLGYYNSLVQEQMMLNPYKYSPQTVVPGNFTVSIQEGENSLNYIEDGTYKQIRNQIFFPTDIQTNLLSVCYTQENENDLYGFMHELADYEITFKVRIKNNLTGQYINPANNLLVRCLPENGIQSFDNLLENTDIKIIKRQNINRDYYINENDTESFCFNPSKYYNYQGHSYEDIRTNENNPKYDFGYVSSGFQTVAYQSPSPYSTQAWRMAVQSWEWSFSQSAALNVQNLEMGLPIIPFTAPFPEETVFIEEYTYYGVTQSIVLNNQLMPPISNFRDFNFMFDKYGQFATYRTLNTKYFKYNDKRYVDIFGDVTQSYSEPSGLGWRDGVTTIKKNFQGGSILSFMINEKMSKIVSYENNGPKEKWTIQLANVQIKKIPYSVAK